MAGVAFTVGFGAQPVDVKFGSLSSLRRLLSVSTWIPVGEISGPHVRAVQPLIYMEPTHA
jgi:hypothetical protein